MTNDGNMLQEPLEMESFPLWVANRVDVVVDFSAFEPGDKVYLVNRLEMRPDGAGETGKLLDEGDLIMRYDVMPQNPDVGDPVRFRIACANSPASTWMRYAASACGCSTMTMVSGP